MAMNKFRFLKVLLVWIILSASLIPNNVVGLDIDKQKLVDSALDSDTQEHHHQSSQFPLAFVKRNNEGRTDIYVMTGDGNQIVNLTKDISILGDNVKIWDMDWSADGSQVAFSLLGTEDDKYAGEIYIMDASGQNLRNFSNNIGNDRYPSWSPDGTKIAFVSQRNRQNDLYVANVDGTDLRQLTNDRSYEEGVDWSMNGNHIVFASIPTGSFELYTINLDTQKIKQLTNWGLTKQPSFPVWSPDSEEIAYLGWQGIQVDLRIMNADGGGDRMLLTSPGGGDQLAWFPEGSMLAFSTQSGIYAVDVNDPTSLELIVEGGYLPVWLPKTTIPLIQALSPLSPPVISDGIKQTEDGWSLEGSADSEATIHVYWRTEDSLPILGQPGVELGSTEADADGNWVLSDIELLPGELEIVAVAEVDGKLSEESEPLKVIVPYAPEIATPISNEGETELIDFQGVIGGTALVGSNIHLYHKTGDLPVIGEPYGAEIGMAIAGEDGSWAFEGVELGVGVVNTFVAVAEIDGLISPPSEMITVDFDIFAAHRTPQASTYGAKYPESPSYPNKANTRQSAQNAANALENLGYNATAYLDDADLDIFNRLYQDSVFYFHGHAGNNQLVFYDEEGGDPQLAAVLLQGRQFPMLDLVVLNGCQAGADPDAPDSIMSAFHVTGADTVIGFKHSVNSTQANIWGEKFWEYVEDYSVGNAATLAAVDSNLGWWSIVGPVVDLLAGSRITEDSIRILGDENLKLSPES